MKIQWARIALVAVAMLGARAAAAQEAAREYVLSRGGWIPDNHLLAALALLPPPLPPFVILGGKGGSIQEHISHFWTLARSGAPVEMRGGCYSACTLITAHVPKEKLCFAPGSFLAFHAATWTQTPPHQISPSATLQMYQSYPLEIRQWINRNGGYEKLTIEAYWTMYDRDLWAIGYARCK